MASSLKTWKMDYEQAQSDKKSSCDPPGYDASIAKEAAGGSSSAKKKDQSMLARKQQALYARATAPIRQIAFFCFMAWMSGNGIQIFSIIMTFSLLAQPISAILNSGATFRFALTCIVPAPTRMTAVFPLEADWPQLDTTLPRLLYCLVQGGQLMFGLYKLNGMGLLPVYASDWISSLKVPPALEHSFAPVQ